MIGSARTGTSFGGLQGYLIHGRSREDKDSREDQSPEGSREARESQEPQEGLQEYLTGHDERVSWTSTRNLFVRDPEEAAYLMTATADQNVRVQKPVYHLSLSASPGEDFTKEEWLAVSERVLRHLGLEDHQALIVAHNDTTHPHIHLMVNRVHPETLKVWHNGHDYRRIEEVLRHIERDRGLRAVPGHHFQLDAQTPPTREAAPTSGERRETERTGKESWADSVRFQVYGDLKGAENWGDLERRLARHGLRLRRRGGGLVVTDGTRQVKASRLYRNASYRALEKRFGMSFEEWRSGLGRLVEAVSNHQNLVRRQRHLDSLGDRASGLHASAAREVKRRRDVRLAARDTAQAITRGLHQVFRPEDVPAARRRLVAHAREHGWSHAARALQQDPRRFGRLRPPSLRRPLAVRTQLRDRGRSVYRLSRLVGNMASLRSIRAVAGPAGFRAGTRILLAQQIAGEVKRGRQGLPSRRASLLEIASRAATLGVNAASLVLQPEPLKLVRLALRTAQLVRSASRGL